MDRLPRLDAIRAFEAAARHLSITVAADELCVTPAAVSRQIRAREETLGVQPLHRGRRQITPTGPADDYYRASMATFRTGLLEQFMPSEQA
jgi:LysR family glycine cleavage system transcriptional activator